eukprot:TRINITY_DN101166_c0_g1_i1.p1 TRINITY_DN101166_c0_g1~~TRINITY_DN101166_c0_g1_i1.p1  ORF type:complete len:372 (+),score=55.19 TRINITY_DN101166_c0_g1_i1:203-1318(+)
MAPLMLFASQLFGVGPTQTLPRSKTAVRASGHGGGGRVSVITDKHDSRLALYQPKNRRDVAQYESCVRVLAATALGRASSSVGGDATSAATSSRMQAAASAAKPRRRMLRRRSGSACFDDLGCAVGVHHHWSCLRRLSRARQGGRQIHVDSVLLPTDAPTALVNDALAASDDVMVAGSRALGRALGVESDAGSSLEDGEDADDEVACRFAVAWPMPRPLDLLKPPFVILEDLGSSMNIGQIVHSAFVLGITSFIVTKAAWRCLNGRAARVSDGWLYYVDFHVAASIGSTLREVRNRGVKVYAAEDFHPHPVAPHQPLGDSQWALLLGNEDRGVTDESLQLCDSCVCVPQFRGASLNVAAAASICLHELSRS